MNILFLTDNFPPEHNAPATRTYEHCKEWSDAGHNVTVMTCAPNFPGGIVYEGFSNRWRVVEEIDGIKVIRVWTYITANSGFIKRILDYFSFSVISAIQGLREKPDVIIATSPQFFTTWSARFLSKIKRVPWIFELRDLWPESIATVGALKKGMIYRVLEKIELSLYRSSHIIVANSPAFKTNLENRGVDGEKIHVVPNGANLELFKPQEKNRQLMNELGLEGKFVYGYLGTHGMAHSLDFIIESISKIKRDDLHFLFIGDGAAKERVVKRAEELECKNITFLDPVPKEEIRNYLSVIDAALVPLKKSDTFKTVIPSKIFESCAMHKPILLGVDGQARELIEEHGAGIYFEPENARMFIRKVFEMADKQEMMKMLAQNAGKLARSYDRKKMAARMLSIIENQTNGVGYQSKQIASVKSLPQQST